ncbi:unnamed protein product [Camellia sinensis]
MLMSLVSQLHLRFSQTLVSPIMMQIGDIVDLKSIIRLTEIVAIGVLKGTGASKEVKWEELGPDYWEVHVQVPVKPNESLIQ